MRRLALFTAPLIVALAGPAFAADLDERYIERHSEAPPPPVVDRKVVEHHYYYHEEPTIYRERRVIVEPRVVVEEPFYAERLYPRRHFAFAYRDWRRHGFFRGHRRWAYGGHGRW